MGAGFLEAVYQECLSLEFTVRDIPFAAMPSLLLNYKGFRLKQTYCPDFICFDSIVIELKAVRETAAEHSAQVFNYLRHRLAPWPAGQFRRLTASDRAAARSLGFNHEPTQTSTNAWFEADRLQAMSRKALHQESE